MARVRRSEAHDATRKTSPRYSRAASSASCSAQMPQPSWKPICSCVAQSAEFQWAARALADYHAGRVKPLDKIIDQP